MSSGVKVLQITLVSLLLAILASCRSGGTVGDDSASAVAAGFGTAAKAVNDTWPVDSKDIPLAGSLWAKSLQALPTDSLFRLGTDFTSGMSVRADSALVCFMTAIGREHTAMGDDELLEIAKCQVNAAHVYATSYHKTGLAFKCLQEAERICKAHDFKALLSYVWLNMGVNMSNEDKLQSSYTPGSESAEAFRYLEQAYDSAELAGNHEVMAYSVYNMMSDYDFSPVVIGYVDRYLEADISDSESSRPYVVAMCLGYKDLANGEYASAHKRFEAADTLCTAEEPLICRFLDQTRFMDGLAYEYSGDTAQASGIFNAILQEAMDRGDLEFGLWMEGNLYLYHTRQGNKDVAERYLLDYYRIREQIALAEDSLRIDDIKMQDRIDGYERELAKARIPAAKPLWLRVALVAALLLFTALVIALMLYRRRLRYVMAMYEKHMEERGQEADRPSAADQDSVPNGVSDLPDPDLVGRIAEIMDRSDEVFDPEFQMVKLCAMVETNSTYVSRAVNAHYGKPFKTVLAERRVREACRRLDDPQTNATLTIEAVGNEVGFKSRTAFSIAFKNQLGISPTEYRKAAQRYMPPQS